MLREFFSWWCAQLADLLPQELRRSALGAGDALVITPIGPLGRGVEAVAVDQRHNGKETPLGHFALGAIGMADLPRTAGTTTVLRLGEADVLGKTVSLPLAAERELDQALAFEMDRETPFTAEELYWNHRVIGGRPAERAIVGAPLRSSRKRTSTRYSPISLQSEFGRGGWRSPTVRTKGPTCRSTGTELASITPRIACCGRPPRAARLSESLPW